jgi:hypothetical protein
LVSSVQNHSALNKHAKLKCESQRSFKCCLQKALVESFTFSHNVETWHW